MIGRGARIFEEKTHFNILDFGGNVKRLGVYTQPREWYLWHEESRGGGVAPVKECGYDSDGKAIKPDKFDLFVPEKGCRRLIMASMKICPFCGFKYPKKKLKSVDLNLSANGLTTEQYEGVKNKSIRQMSHEELYV